MSDRKIIDYDILTNSNEGILKVSVKGAIKKGWQPLGGMATSTVATYDLKCYQAMVKYEETKEK